MIRIILSNNLRLNLAEMFGTATECYLGQGKTFVHDLVAKASEGRDELSGLKVSFDALTGSDLRDFFADRLKVQLREQGARHDLADAVLALPGENDLVTIVSASRRSANSSTPTTAKTCSPAPSAPPTSCASRKRRTATAIPAIPIRRF